MQKKLFKDKNLSHKNSAILSDSKKKIILIDFARNPQQYFKQAKENHAQIACVIETHPHADFVSSHVELLQATGATLYTSKKRSLPAIHFYW